MIVPEINPIKGVEKYTRGGVEPDKERSGTLFLPVSGDMRLRTNKAVFMRNNLRQEEDLVVASRHNRS